MGETRAAPAFTIERFLPFRLSVLSNRLTRAAARVYSRRFRLSAPEWRAMAVLGRYGAMNANSVVDRTAMDKVRVSRAVARLTAAGHITRRVDPADHRRAILDLTPQGTTMYHQIVPWLRAVQEEILAGLDAGERSALEQLLAKLEQRSATIAQHRGNADAFGD
ncbi:MAG TPA: MarR family winged helix-turn-helix transcriptional regulator [Stellaceae bacterium]|nr:MarR family winged helix-turn-helix transcriptional regulator [Stellaceae bacterium]